MYACRADWLAGFFALEHSFSISLLTFWGWIILFVGASCAVQDFSSISGLYLYMAVPLPTTKCKKKKKKSLQALLTIPWELGGGQIILAESHNFKTRGLRT